MLYLYAYLYVGSVLGAFAFFWYCLKHADRKGIYNIGRHHATKHREQIYQILNRTKTYDLFQRYVLIQMMNLSNFILGVSEVLLDLKTVKSELQDIGVGTDKQISNVQTQTDILVDSSDTEDENKFGEDSDEPANSEMVELSASPEPSSPEPSSPEPNSPEPNSPESDSPESDSPESDSPVIQKPRRLIQIKKKNREDKEEDKPLSSIVKRIRVVKN